MNRVDSIMKTLYIIDLAGTLMRDDKTISEESVAILSHLLSQETNYVKNKRV